MNCMNKRHCKKIIVCLFVPNYHHYRLKCKYQTSFIKNSFAYLDAVTFVEAVTDVEMGRTAGTGIVPFSWPFVVNKNITPPCALNEV